MSQGAWLLFLVIGIVAANSKTICGPGTFVATLSKSNNEQVCEKCLPGFFNNATDAFSCEACEPGFFADRDNSTHCTRCPPGTFMNMPGGISCFPCPLHHFNNDSRGATACQECPDNMFTSTVGSTTCERCPVGTSLLRPNICKPCALGTINPVAGERCTECPRGTSTSSERSVKCFLCKPGTYWTTQHDLNGRVSLCKPCEPGYYAAVFGATQCIKCPKGYTNNRYSSSCVPETVSMWSKLLRNWSAMSVLHNLCVVLLFLGVTDLAIQKIRSLQSEWANALQPTLILVLLSAGQIFSFDADAHLLALVGLLYWNWEYPVWYKKIFADILDPLHPRVMCTAMGMLVAYMNSSILIAFAQLFFSVGFFSSSVSTVRSGNFQEAKK